MASNSRWTTTGSNTPRTCLVDRESTVCSCRRRRRRTVSTALLVGLVVLVPPPPRSNAATPHGRSSGRRRYNYDNHHHHDSGYDHSDASSDPDRDDSSIGATESYENSGWPVADLWDSLSEGFLQVHDSIETERFLYHDDDDSIPEISNASYEQDTLYSDVEEEEEPEQGVNSIDDSAVTRTTTKRHSRVATSTKRPNRRRVTTFATSNSSLPNAAAVSKPVNLSQLLNRSKTDNHDDVRTPRTAPPSLHASHPTTVVPVSTTSAAAPPPTATTTTTTSSSSSSSPGMSPWVRHYLSTRPGLLVVPFDFMEDNFNLAHLARILESWVQVSPHTRGIQFPSGEWLYQQALQRLVARGDDGHRSNHTTTTTTADTYPADHDDDAGVVKEIVDWAAALLYQLIHQRYAVSPRGLEAIRRRFVVWHYQSSRTLLASSSLLPPPPPYGRCPRPTCRGYALVPLGPDTPVLEDNTTVRRHGHDLRPWRYCGLCHGTWRLSPTDGSEGCAWGTTVGPLFHVVYPQFLQDTLWDSAPWGGRRGEGQ